MVTIAYAIFLADVASAQSPTVTLSATCVAPCSPGAASISLVATPTTTAAGRTIKKVEFYREATLIGTVNAPATWTFSIPNVNAGNYSFWAKAFDSAATPVTGNSSVQKVSVGTNFAASANGGTATASSTATNFATAAAINGDRKGTGWGTTSGGWRDNTSAAFPDWLQVNFSASRSISEIDLFTAQTDTASPVEPTYTSTFTANGLRSFTVETWNGTAWSVVSGGSVTNSSLVWTRFRFTPVTTDRIRIQTSAALNSFSRVAEIEAWGTPLNAAPTIGLVATCTAPCTNPGTVSLTATPADAGGAITKVEFYRGTTLLASPTAAPWTYSDTALGAGSYSYTAKVFDNGTPQLTTTSAAQAITVAVAAPTVSLTATCSATPCNAPAAVNLSATAATVAAGRTILRVEFYDGATKVGEDLTAPYTLAVTNVTGGAHNYTAKAIDSAATPLTTTSAQQTITVLTANAAPTIGLVATCTAPCTNPGTVSLTATPADAGGAITKVEFYRGTTLLASPTAAPWTYSDTALGAGSYSYTAKVFDNGTPQLTTTSAAQAITVAVAAPTVSLTATCSAPCESGSNVTFSSPQPVEFSLGRISRIAYFVNGVKVGEAYSEPWEFTANNVIKRGVNTFQAQAFDDTPGATVSQSNLMTLAPITAGPDILVVANCLTPCIEPAVVEILIDAVPIRSFDQSRVLNFASFRTYDGGELVDSTEKLGFRSNILGQCCQPIWDGQVPYRFTLDNVRAGSHNIRTVVEHFFDGPGGTVTLPVFGKTSFAVASHMNQVAVLVPDGSTKTVSVAAELEPILRFGGSVGEAYSLFVTSNSAASAADTTSIVEFSLASEYCRSDRLRYITISDATNLDAAEFEKFSTYGRLGRADCVSNVKPFSAIGNSPLPTHVLHFEPKGAVELDLRVRRVDFQNYDFSNIGQSDRNFVTRKASATAIPQSITASLVRQEEREISLNSPPIRVDSSTPGRAVRNSFSLSVNQRATIVSAASASKFVLMSSAKPGVILDSWSNSSVRTYRSSVAERLTIVAYQDAGAPDQATLAVSVPTALGSITDDGVPFIWTPNSAPAAATLTLNASAGTRYTIGVGTFPQELSRQSFTMSVESPSGSMLVENVSLGYASGFVPTETGLHRISLFQYERVFNPQFKQFEIVVFKQLPVVSFAGQGQIPVCLNGSFRNSVNLPTRSDISGVYITAINQSNLNRTSAAASGRIEPGQLQWSFGWAGYEAGATYQLLASVYLVSGLAIETSPITVTMPTTEALDSQCPYTVTTTATCTRSPCRAPATITLSALQPRTTAGNLKSVIFLRYDVVDGVIDYNFPTQAIIDQSPWIFDDRGVSVGTYQYSAVAINELDESIVVESQPHTLVVEAASPTVTQIDFAYPPVADACSIAKYSNALRFDGTGAEIERIEISHSAPNSYATNPVAKLQSIDSISNLVTFNWSAVPGGYVPGNSYTLHARAFLKNGNAIDAPPISVTFPSAVTVDQSCSGMPFVAFDSTVLAPPSAGQEFSNTVLVNGVESAFPVSRVEVTMRNSSTLVTTVIFSSSVNVSSRYNFSWSGYISGSYELVATAVLSNGGRVTTLPRTVVLQAGSQSVAFANPTAAPASPGAPYTNTVNIGQSNAQDKVEVFAKTVGGATSTKIATMTGLGPHTFSWTGYASGNYELTATLTNGAGVATTSLTITVTLQAAGPSVVIDPTFGTGNFTTDEGTISLTGTILGAKNVAISINGQRYPVDANGRFVADGIRLAAGGNPFTFDVSSIGGRATSSLNINRSAIVSPYVVTLGAAAGVIPFNTTVSVENLGVSTWTRVAIDLDDDGLDTRTEDTSAPVAEQTIVTQSIAFTQAGRYRIRVRAYDASNVVLFQSYKYILVTDPTNQASIVREVYQGFQDKLRASDIPSALAHISDASIERFRSTLNAIGPTRFAQYLSAQGSSGFGEEVAIVVTDTFVEMLVVRGSEPNVRGYRIYFTQDIDGLWRIVEM
jgi:hypothetical protein